MHRQRQDASGDSDAAEVGHLVGVHGDAVAREGAGGGTKHEVEYVLSVDGEAADLSAVDLYWL